MNINEFIEKFIEALDLDESEIINPETKFREIGIWDSLAHLNLILMLDEEYDSQIEESELRNLSTIQDLFNFISK